MSKSRKHKRNVKNRSKLNARSRRSNERFSKSTKGKGTPKATGVDSTVATLLAGRAGGKKKGQIEMGDFADVLEETTSIISIVKDLEEQVDAAFKLKQVLEAELNATQKKLSEELDAHAQLKTQVRSLEAQAVLAAQLSDDISFVEEERDRFASLLSETQPQLEAVSDERDSLSKKLASAEARTYELEGERTTLEAQVMNLKDKAADRDHLRGQVDNLRGELTSADSRVANLRIQLEEQQAANRDLMETRTRLECEVKMAKADHDTTKHELEALKKALYDIRSEATRTSGRVRQRYFKPKRKR